MMKKQIALVALLFLGMSCFDASAQFKKFNLGKAIQAGKDAAQAISLSDADIAAMSKSIWSGWTTITHWPSRTANTENAWKS